MTFNALILMSNAAILLTNLFCCFIPAGFSTFPGAYYSYLFAKLYAAHIWHAHFAADPLNR